MRWIDSGDENEASLSLCAVRLLNSSFGIGPEFGESGTEGPSVFPRTSVGARWGWKPADNVVLRAALLDGVPLIRPDGAYRVYQRGDGVLAVSELALLARPGDGSQGDQRSRLGRNSMLPPYEGKLAFGAWHYTTTLDRLDGAADLTQNGTSGAYVVGDRVVEHDPANPNRNLSLFVQLGVADDRINRFSTYFGGGLVAAGPFGTRPNEEVGLAVAIARNGSAFQHHQASVAPASRAETAVDLTYLIQATAWLA